MSFQTLFLLLPVLVASFGFVYTAYRLGVWNERNSPGDRKSAFGVSQRNTRQDNFALVVMIILSFILFAGLAGTYVSGAHFGKWLVENPSSSEK